VSQNLAKNIDWELIRSFLQVAQSGSLSKAAQQLAVSQPTLSRQIQQLESITRLNLFKRSTQGLEITEQGSRLLESAQIMQDAADRFARQIAGLDGTLRGEVRISVSEIIGVYYLPAAIAAFQAQHPDVKVDVVISNEVSSLSKREADIALRMYRPQQPDLICRRLPDHHLGIYAHRDYLHDDPNLLRFEDMQAYHFVGYDSDMSLIEGAREQGVELKRDDFSLRTDSLVLQHALVQGKAGFGILHSRLAERTPDLVRLFPDVPIPSLQMWCVCHRDLQFNNRIRAAMQFIADWFARDDY